MKVQLEGTLSNEIQGELKDGSTWINSRLKQYIAKTELEQ